MHCGNGAIANQLAPKTYVLRYAKHFATGSTIKNDTVNTKDDTPDAIHTKNDQLILRT